jgi:hypothetical protein
MDSQEIKSWVRQHEVTWELSPWQEMLEGGATNVGLELRLFAQHDAGDHPSPGCERCVALYEKLREITSVSLPAEPHASRRHSCSSAARVSDSWRVSVDAPAGER